MQKWISKYSKWWKNYKFRFVPWIALNVKRYEPIKDLKTTSTSRLISASASHDTIFHPTFENETIEIHKNVQTEIEAVPVHHLQKSKEKLITDTQLTKLLTTYLDKCKCTNVASDMEDISFHNKKVMKEHFGFVVERRQSQVSPDAGTGVFITEGVAVTGSVVALYCGTLYMPSEPLFFPSLANKYIFRCADGNHIDGNDKWISKSIYKSCAARDKFDFDTEACDTSWLTPYPMNPLNVGQYVNNRSHSQKNNVMYQECTITWDYFRQGQTGSLNDCTSSGSNFENLEGQCGRGDRDKLMEARDVEVEPQRIIGFHIRNAKFIPNVWNYPSNVRHWNGLRVVPLVALRDIHQGEELLSSYFTVVHADKKEQ